MNAWCGALAAVIVALLASEARPEPPAAAQFARKPTASRTADGVKIEFAVSAAIDVAVYVEDGTGPSAGSGQAKVVRHLAAGVLGKNAPAPLVADSLSQSIVWDGKDDAGKPCDLNQPFKVRVGLGLGGRHDKVLIANQQSIAGVNALAVGPDGTLYVMMAAGGTGPVWSGQIMLAYDRQGNYVRQVMPFPADLKMDEAAGFDVVSLNGKPAPLVHNIQARSFYASQVARKAGMAVTPSGVLLTMVAPCNLGAIDGRGAAVWGKYVGPSLQPKLARPRFTGRPFVAAASDGKSAFVSGLVDNRLDAKGNPQPKASAAVYRVKLPERSGAEPFFGDPAASGADDAHLGGPPHGVAVDGKGRVLIADYANNRVVAVNEADGKFIKAIPIEAGAAVTQPASKKPRGADTASGPDCLAADPKTGAIYVTRLQGGGRIELIKIKSIDEPTVVARLALANSGNPDCPWLLALDPGATPPVCWLGSDGGSLLRIEDQGDAFGKPLDVGKSGIGNGGFVDLSIERSRGEVYTRCGMGSGAYWWFRINDATGEVGKVTLSPIPSAAGSQMVPGPDGSLYCPAYPYHLLRFSHEGKPMPWGLDEAYPKGEQGKGDKVFKVAATPHGRYSPVSMTFLTHTIGVRQDGHVFMFEPSHPGDRPPKMLMEYDANGKLVGGPIIWKVSDTAVGPKFDRQGNIYIAEQVKPLDQPCPPEFADLVGKVEPDKSLLEGVKGEVVSMYGSIVKFSPKGGMVHVGGENPFAGEPALDPSLASCEAGSSQGWRFKRTKVTGALWMRMGVSHVDLISCNCENTRFDVDDFGRVFYPDMGRFRVCVLDTNGNLITEFGEYGNADTADKIAFSWLIGVAASDRYAYMGDSLNRRLLRAKLLYAVEESCPVGR